MSPNSDEFNFMGGRAVGNDVHQQQLAEQSGTVNDEKGNGYVMDGWLER